MERNTPDGICTWLSEEFNRPGWQSTRVAQELSNEVLDMVLMRYDHYHQSAKLGVLFALLYVRKNDLLRMKWTMQKVNIFILFSFFFLILVKRKFKRMIG